MLLSAHVSQAIEPLESACPCISVSSPFSSPALSAPRAMLGATLCTVRGVPLLSCSAAAKNTTLPSIIVLF